MAKTEEITFLCSHCGSKESSLDQAEPLCGHCGSMMHPASSFSETASTSGTFYSGLDRFSFVYSVAIASVLFAGCSVFFSFFGFWFPVLNFPVAFVGFATGAAALILGSIDRRAAEQGISSCVSKESREQSRFQVERLSKTLKIAKWGCLVSSAVMLFWVVRFSIIFS